MDWEDALVATAKTLRAAGEKTAVVAGGLCDAEVAPPHWDVGGPVGQSQCHTAYELMG